MEYNGIEHANPPRRILQFGGWGALFLASSRSSPALLASSCPPSALLLGSLFFSCAHCPPDAQEHKRAKQRGAQDQRNRNNITSCTTPVYKPREGSKRSHRISPTYNPVQPRHKFFPYQTAIDTNIDEACF